MVGDKERGIIHFMNPRSARDPTVPLVKPDAGSDDCVKP